MNKPKLLNYGGQALIEGVMMRGSKAAAIAMRAPNQEIVIQTEPLGRIYKSKVAKIPFLRGLVILWDALGLGMRALTVSANMQTGEDEKLEGPTLYLILIAAIALAVLLFFMIPASLGQLASHYLSISQWWSNLLEGLVRLLILICYIWAVGKIPEIDRVFAYHGAEHKTINAFEAGAELTPDSVNRFSVEHPRCGTAFLLDVVLLSVILYSFLGPLSIAWRLASRILLIPIIAGIAYEYLRWTANHLESPLVRMLIKPNLALQRLTTREPTLAMLEVSIASFNAMRQAEQEKVAL
jgi:uncharacterized protein YqhQ